MIARAMSKAEQDSVKKVLSKFFTKTDSGYVHKRVEQEIDKQRELTRLNREKAKKGGRPPKRDSKTYPEKNPPGFLRDSDRVQFGYPENIPSQEPIANSQLKPASSPSHEDDVPPQLRSDIDPETGEILWGES